MITTKEKRDRFVLIYYTTKKRALQKGVPFTLTKEDYKKLKQLRADGAERTNAQLIVLTSSMNPQITFKFDSWRSTYYIMT